MENKQTAVKWLIQNIVEDQTIKAKSMIEWISIFEQAKGMEKQQHKETWFLSTSQFANESEMLYKKDFEQYFNEKFKNK
jgi:hypothetical protein